MNKTSLNKRISRLSPDKTVITRREWRDLCDYLVYIGMAMFALMKDKPCPFGREGVEGWKGILRDVFKDELQSKGMEYPENTDILAYLHENLPISAIKGNLDILYPILQEGLSNTPDEQLQGLI